MNDNEIDKLIPLIASDNLKELYPLVQSVNDLSRDDPLIFKTIADRFAKKNRLNVLNLKFYDRIEDESTEDVQRFYNYIVAKFYLSIISQQQNRSTVLELLDLMRQNRFPNLTQVVSRIKALDCAFPTRLISWLGKLLILLNLDFPPIPSEYVVITVNYLNSLLRAITNDYYSKDSSSFIEVVTSYFHLFGIVIEIVFHRIEEWDDLQLDKYGGELEDYHEHSIDLVLKHEIKLQIRDNILTFKTEDLYAQPNIIKEITEFNNLKSPFVLQHNNIINNEDYKAEWLTKHLELLLSEGDFKKWRAALSDWKSKARARRGPAKDGKIIQFYDQKIYQYEAYVVEDFEFFSDIFLEPKQIHTTTRFPYAKKTRDIKIYNFSNGVFINDENTRIKTLSFQKAGLTEIPESIGDLKELRYLNLKNNKLTTVPESIRELKKLKTLHLGGNQIKILPEWIGSLPSLRKLDLSVNFLKDLPRSLSKLQNLVFLDIGGNNFRKVPKCVFDLKNLLDLSLDGNKLMTLPEEIGNLRKLEYLNLNSNRMRFLPETFANLKSMKKLFLDYNRFCSVPKQIEGLLELRKLSIRGPYDFYKQFRGYVSEIAHLDRSVKLVRLNLSHNKIKQISGLQRLKLLEDLNLEYNQIETISSLENQTNLQTLNLHGNLIKKIENMDTLTKLEFLHLGSNNIETLSGLKNLKQLNRLYLDSNKIDRVINKLGGFSIYQRVADPAKLVEYCKK